MLKHKPATIKKININTKIKKINSHKTIRSVCRK